MFSKIRLSLLFFLAVLLSVNLSAQYPDARRTGEEVLYEALLGAKGFYIVVESNGCTQKESFKIETTKKINPDGTTSYLLTVLRKMPDECKRLPEQIVLYFDLEKDLGLKGRFTYSLSNKIFPAAISDSLSSIVEKYFTLDKANISKQEKTEPATGKVKTETSFLTTLKEELEHHAALIRSELKEAMLFAIQSEVDRYRQRGDKKKVEELSQQLEKFRSLPETEIPLPSGATEAEATPFLSPGPILPPQVRTAEIIVKEPLQIGSLLEVKGMTRSGPFYHLAGYRDDILQKLQPGKIHKVYLCLIYKREYFGFIPNY
ncbi:MAG: hypothetical protein H5U07_10950, partial [Candidatus Aminicenantes bacterium]|nr:hypothetical protein [Candidatus Aminicenantes bacterium]